MPRYDDAAILARLDATHAALAAPDGTPAKPWHSLTTAITGLMKDWDMPAALRLSLMPIDRWRLLHPLLTRRITILDRLHAFDAMEEEVRHFATSPDIAPEKFANVQSRMIRAGLSWRLTDCMPQTSTIFNDLDCSAMEWLCRPIAPFQGLPPRFAQARSDLLRARGVPEIPATTAAFDRADTIRIRYRWLLAAANQAARWPDDPQAQRIAAFHQFVIRTLPRCDLSPLLASRDQGRSVIVLFSHLVPISALHILHGVGLPMDLITRMPLMPDATGIVSVLGSPSEVNFRLLALAKRMSRAQSVLAIYPDYAKNSAGIEVTLLGIPGRISLGAGAFARRRASQFFYADTRILGDHIEVTFQPGPCSGPEQTQAEAEDLLRAFYIDRLSHSLTHPPGQIATPSFFAADGAEDDI